jgi:pyruvate ferredoxin oxidoreductase gamma subunit
MPNKMKKDLIQIRVHGRGGQGVVTAAELIALAAFYDNKYAQAFPFFGVERSGAPIMAFARISNNKIKTREQVYTPDFLIIQDATLLDDEDILKGSHAGTKILINTPDDKEKIYKKLTATCSKSKSCLLISPNNIFTTKATEIAMEIIGRNIVNTVILGALVKYGKLFTMESLKKAVKEKFQEKGESIISKNIAAISKIYESN